MNGMSMMNQRMFNVTYGRTVKVFDPKHPDQDMPMPMMYMNVSNLIYSNIFTSNIYSS